MMNKFHSSCDGSFKLVSGSLKELVGNAQITRDRTEEEKECLRSLTSEYEDDKNRNETRVPDTCLWFLEHEKYCNWRHEPTASLLWVSADPGCGKSVLSRSLVDEGLLKSNTGGTSVCYFFFKDDDQSRQGGANAMCAILHQLFIQKPILLKHAMHEFEHHGEHIRTMFSVLWRVLEESAADTEAGEIICVLDALDECGEAAREELIQELGCFHSSRNKLETKLKFLVTSRPYIDIERAFFSNAEDITLISAEDESEKISKEIDLVISVQVPRICGARKPPLATDVQQALVSCLKMAEHRTYLWLHLTLDVVKKSLESTKFELEQLIKKLPRTVEDAYDKILRKIDAEHAPEARRILHIVVAAFEPLTLGEIRIALAINKRLRHGGPWRSYHELDLETEEAFRVKLRNLCGLFLIVVDSKVYLLHQMAKEFLTSENLQEKSASSLGLTTEVWKHSLAPVESNLIILKICLSYLSPCKLDDGDPFSDYVMRNWVDHFRLAKAGVGKSVLQSTLDVCQPETRSFRRWWPNYNGYWSFRSQRFTCHRYHRISHSQFVNSLMVASAIGLETVVEYLLEKGSVELNFRNNDGQTALYFAVKAPHIEVIPILVNQDGIELNFHEKDGETLSSLLAMRQALPLLQWLPKQADAGFRYTKYPLVDEEAEGEGALEVVKVILQKHSINYKLHHNNAWNFPIEIRDM